jgi:hypothetical protein
MSEPTSGPGETLTRSEISTEIERSMSSIWQRRNGTRPVAIETEYVGDVVRCVIEDAEDAEDAAAANDTIGYRHEVQSTIARLTRRNVQAYMAGRDKSTGRAKQTFILEPVRVKN